jgi:predicted secreted protein
MNGTMDEVLGKLREARALCKDEMDNGGRSRELSLVITKIDEALLWKIEDRRLKRPPVNECAPEPA